MKQKRCSICGNIHNTVNFKCGYVCEDCIDYIKNPLPEVAPPAIAKSSDSKRRESLQITNTNK